MSFIEKYMEKSIKRVSMRLGLQTDNKKKTNLLIENYVMPDSFTADELVVGKFEWVSSDVTDCGPVCKKTDQNYIFRPIVVDDEIKYQEIFTGFIASDGVEYFDLPYIADMVKFTDVLSDYKGEEIPKLGMLLVVDEVNKAVMSKSPIKEKIGN